ncbi:MAG: hypothetical protein ABJE10_11630 [bacterium]
MYLTAAAFRAAAERFGATAAEPIELTRVPTSCVLLYGAGELPAWGIAEARKRLSAR